MKKLFRRPRVKPDDSNASNGSTSEEVYGLFPLVSDLNGTYDIDIVAVHGLGGHWTETWTDTSDDRKSLWLRDFLPSQLKEEAGVRARVLSYGYDSTTAFSKSVSDIEDQAGALLHALNVERMSPAEKKRPIIFVAHSLGGIIVKKALITANERSSQYGSLLNSVSGMILFGVPHRGSDVAYWASFAANVLNASPLGANPNFVNPLQKNSRAFADISQQFIERAAHLKKIYTFYELDKLHNILVVDKDSARLVLPNEIPVAVSANHRDICKFSDADSTKYRPIWKAVQILCVESMDDQASCPPTARFLVRFPQDKDFVGREDILRQISVNFATQRRVALDGIGGVGKSQIAIEYCYRFREAHPKTHIFWIHAGSVGRFDQAYKSIARHCSIPGWDNPAANALQLVYEWLSDEGNGSWLMVLDNADDKSVFSNQDRGNVAQEIDQDDDALNLLLYLPQRPHGSILITSRNRDAAYRLTNSVESIIDVPLMDAELAMSLLSNKLPEDQRSLDGRLELVDLLDRLPLAITQASAFISMRKTSISQYIKYFRENAAILLEDMGDIRRDPTMKHSVILTWHISFNQIKKENGPAAELLSLMSVLDRQGIPRFLVRAGKNDLSFDNAIAPLLDFSLVSKEEDGNVFEMHRLVQIATRTWLENHKEKALWEGTAVTLLADFFPSGDYETWETCASLMPHTNVLAEYQYSSSQHELQLASLLSSRAWYLYKEGRGDLAKQDAQRVLETRLRLIPKEEFLVSDAMDLKATILYSEGDYLTAEKLYRQSLVMTEQICGTDDADTQTARMNLGACLKELEKYEEAVQILQPLFESHEKRLGKRDGVTLRVMGHLALVLKCQKRFDEAEELCQQRLDILLEMKGGNHAEVINCMGFEMSRILLDRGSFERAEELSRRASELAKEVYGPGHPRTLRILRILQRALYATGKDLEAEDLGRHVLSLSEKVLGEDQENTLISVNSLANTLDSQKKYEEAESLRRRALSGSERRLGKEHVDTVIYRSNLIRSLEVYYDKHEEAEKMLQDLVIEGKGEEADKIRRWIQEGRWEV